MQEKGRVIAVDGDTITIVPQDIGACINCSNTACKKNGHKFTAVNARHFDIRPGMDVTVAAPARKVLLQTVTGVVLPVFCAALGYAAAIRYLFSHNQAAAGGCAVGVFFLSCGLFSILNRKNDTSRLPEITGVM